MKLALTLGVAFTAITLAAAAANTTHTRTIIRHGGGGAEINMDADNDGWLSRAEASAAADQIFAQMDTNNDGRLTSEDRPAVHHARFRAPDVDVDVEVELDGDRTMIWEDEAGGERRITIRRGENLTEEEEARIEREVEQAMTRAEQAMERAEAQAERAEAQAERAARHAERLARDAAREGERHVSREVIVVHANGEDMVAPVAPVAPVPPRPPMFMMLVANSEEADTNGDGALSREEFRAQHLRFFDASDANGDGRVRFEEPPAPPAAPAPPAPPAPPRR